MKEKRIGIIIYTIVLMFVFGLALTKTRRDCELDKQAAVEEVIKEASIPTASDVIEKGNPIIRNNEVELYIYEDFNKQMVGKTTYAVVIRNGETTLFVEK